MLWILVQKESLEIPPSHSYNHVIAALYKIDYALEKGVLNPSCTSPLCSWNKSTKCEIEQKKIKDIVIRKKVRSKSNNEELDTIKKVKGLENRKNLTQCYKNFPKLKDEKVYIFYSNLHDVNQQSAVLSCIHSKKETELEAFLLENIASKMSNASKDLTQEKHIAKFLGSLPVSRKSSESLEIKTRGQSDNDLWSVVRKGRLTISNYHDVFTEIDRVIKKTNYVIECSSLELNKMGNIQLILNVTLKLLARLH